MSRKAVLFADEAGFSIHPKLGRVWVKKGTQPRVKTYSRHTQRVNVFGWVDPVSGRHGMMHADRGNTVGFIAFLKVLLFRQQGRIELWVDHAKWHKGNKVERFCSVHNRLSIRYIPKYHPELNFQERLWKQMRYEETTNTFYENCQHLKNAIFNRSQIWRPKKITNLCKLI